MHNWAAERDFFADGSRGQRIYVHPPTRTIIVQLAEDSNQDFPFRRIAHYLANEPIAIRAGSPVSFWKPRAPTVPTRLDQSFCD